jgi:hypothetical protein
MARTKNAACERTGILEILRQPAATPQPAECALDNPTLGQQHEALRRVWPLYDFEGNSCCIQNGLRRCFALVSAIGDGLLDRGKTFAADLQQRRDYVSILKVRRHNGEIYDETERIDDRVAFFTLDLFSGVISRRINFRPPFSAAFTLWLSTIASVGSAAFPASSRARLYNV